MKQYEKYKPSGIEWLGEIPEHWEVALLTKNLFSLVDYRGKTPRKLENDETGMLLVTARNIKGGKIDYSLSEEYVDVLEAKKLLLRGSLNIGDVLFTTEAPLGEVANVDRLDIALAQRIIKFSGIKSKLDNYYLKYWLYSISFQSILKTYATGSTVEGIKGSKLRLLNILLPYLSEQTAIANYLDTKTAAIDRKIELLTAKADKYIALRRSLINETVCRGLPASEGFTPSETLIKMKDSGIEWIGMIPEHWEVKRFKSIANTVKGRNLELSDTYFENSLPNLSLEYLRNESVTFDTYCYAPDKNQRVTTNDMIIIWDGAGVGEILKGKEGFLSSTIAKIVVDRKKYNSKFLYHLRFSIEYILKMIPAGMGIPHLNPQVLNSFNCPCPPLEEQEKIANYLDNKTTQIDTILTNISEQITKLTQLRKTLINDVVTGKIKVAD